MRCCWEQCFQHHKTMNTKQLTATHMRGQDPGKGPADKGWWEKQEPGGHSAEYRGLLSFLWPKTEAHFLIYLITGK